MSLAHVDQTVRLLTRFISPTNNQAMNNFMAIRKRLGLTQAQIAVPLGVSQSNVSFYEHGQTVPPAVAESLIALAAERGQVVTFDDIYKGAGHAVASADSEP